MITGFSDPCTVEYIYSEELQYNARFSNATPQLQQLYVTADQPFLWYTPMGVLAWHEYYNCDIAQTPWGCISFLVVFWLHVALQLIAIDSGPFQSSLLFGLSFSRNLNGNQLTRLPEGLWE